MLSNLWSKVVRSYSVDIFCLAILLIFFYTLFLGGYPLFTPDEGRYSEVAREMIANSDYVTPRVNGVVFLDKPIFYYWLQVFAIKLFGLREWALRFFPAMLGILGCLMTYVCGRRLFNNRRTGLLSALLLATAPLYFGGAHYANLDLEVAVLISSCLLCFITAFAHQQVNKSFLFAAYFFAGLAFLTKGMIGIVFPSMIAGTWIILLQQWSLLKKIHLIKGLLLFAAIVLPWYVLVQKANPAFLHYFFITQQVTRFLSQATFNNQTPIWFYAPVIMIGFFPWTIFLPQALWQTSKQCLSTPNSHRVELFLLLWFVMIFIFFSIPHSKIATYILPVFPALALIVGRYLAISWDQFTFKNKLLTLSHFILLGSLLVGILLAALYYHLANLSAYFFPNIKIIVITLIFSMILGLYFSGKKSLRPFFSVCTICIIICLLSIVQGANYLNQNTAKPLAVQLKTLIKPQDEVISYYKYYQDVPLYLERRISVVADWYSPDIANKDNWMRELWIGMNLQPTHPSLINEKTFWQRWDSEKRVFVFLNDNYLNQFKAHTQHYFQLGRYNDVLLLTNISFISPFASLR